MSKGEVLDTVIKIEPSEFFIVAQHAPQMNNIELRNYLTKQRNRGVGNIQAFKDEYYKRYSMPFSAPILMLIGVSLSSSKVLGGMVLQFGIAIALSSRYVFLSFVSYTFAV